MDGNTLPPRRTRKKASLESDAILSKLSQKIIGQQKATESIVPFVRMYEAGLSPDGRPAGVFLLLGPTGTGKTRTVEALAEVMHGSARHLVRIDCGEYQMEHEVAKLVGAPPGYLGHRETHPVLTQARLASVTSERSSLSIVLFDEVEKAAGSLTRLLLGILDKATLRLGDNNVVNFERSLVFLTSNVGARGIQEEMGPGLGFRAGDRETSESRLENITMRAARRNFSPEFMNRIDAAITYQPLSVESLESILDLQITDLQTHIRTRLGLRAFTLSVPAEMKRFLLQRGVSSEYGAREIRRAVQRYLTQPLAALVADGRIRPGCRVRAAWNEEDDRLEVRAA
jgi:ATP-dependent Clp protease ATP-binding subunit ClpA